MEHYTYMKDTIKSSFEFAKYTFELKEVSRGFIQQLTRTRTQNYAQESMRAVDVRNANFYNEGMCEEYDLAVENISVAIKLNPENPLYLCRRGQCYLA